MLLRHYTCIRIISFPLVLSSTDLQCYNHNKNIITVKRIENDCTNIAYHYITIGSTFGYTCGDTLLEQWCDVDV